MNNTSEGFCGSSARQFSDYWKLHTEKQYAAQEEKKFHRHACDATIALNEQARGQTEILKSQLNEVQKVNELLVKQAADAAQAARRSHWIAIASLFASVLSLACAFFK